MKCFLTIPLALLSLLNAVAQNGPAKPGKIDKSDLTMTDCAFDPGAEACKLIDRRKIYYDRGTNLLKMVAERQTRIKILKEKGTAYADVHIPYYSRNNDERISKIAAYTYNLGPDGSVVVTEVDKASIFFKKLTKNVSEAVIAFPMAKVGSVIEYTYTLERENIGYIEDWYFQDQIPVIYSSLELKAPLLFKFMEAPFVYGDMEQKQDVDSDLIMMGNDLVKVEMLQKSYTMRNLPGVKPEPYMSSTDDYMQRIAFQLAQIDYGNGNVKDVRTTWQQVVSVLNLDEDFGIELQKDVPAAAGLVADAKQLPDTLARMLKIFEGIRSGISWNGSHSIYAMSGLRTVWDKKLGSTGDINILLVNLLRQAGIEAYPLLASTRSNGLINTAFPATQQFNVTLACVYIGGRAYVLNAADRYCPYQFIPMEVANTRGLLIGTSYGYRWLDMLVRHGRNQMTAVQAEVDANGLLKGEATVVSQGYAKPEQCKRWFENKSGFLSAHLPKSFAGLKIDSIAMKNMASDSLGMEQKILFSYPLNSSGGYSYFSLNLFSGFYDNPFLGDKRISDIEFGTQQEFTFYGSYTLPEGWVFEELPKDVTMIMPDTSIVFNSNFQAADNQLRVRMALQFKQSYYPADDYPALQDFYKKLFAKLNEQVVVRKK